MKHILYAVVILCCLITSSCSKSHFEDLLQDPNRPGSVPPSLLLTNVSVASFAGSGTAPTYRAHIMGNAEASLAEQYFTWNRGDYNMYTTLLQVNQMKIEAENRGLKEYTALAKFFYAFNYYKLTMLFGEVPLSNALKATDAMYNPAYDSQKDIFIQILKLLDEANTELIPFSSQPATFSGDVIYNGNALKWRKLINTFSLRVLIALSKRADDPDLQVIEKFKNIVGHADIYPLMESNSDNGQLVYYNLNGNNYPVYKNTVAQRAFLDMQFSNFLTASKDPRIFAFAEITPNALTAGKPKNDFTAYAGADASLLNADLKVIISNKNVSTMNSRYTNDPVCEPHIAIGYAELQFNLAEAAYRGWITDDPETFYKNGIQASMQFYEPYGLYRSADYFPSLYANSDVAYNAGQGLEKIMMQKYIAFFMNSHEEAFFNLRRTSLPHIKLDGGGIQNNAKLPMRWMYPQTEIDRNIDALTTAIQRQYAEGDNINGLMWLLK